MQKGGVRRPKRTDTSLGDRNLVNLDEATHEFTQLAERIGCGLLLLESRVGNELGEGRCRGDGLETGNGLRHQFVNVPKRRQQASLVTGAKEGIVHRSVKDPFHASCKSSPQPSSVACRGAWDPNRRFCYVHAPFLSVRRSITVPYVQTAAVVMQGEPPPEPEPLW